MKNFGEMEAYGEGNFAWTKCKDFSRDKTKGRILLLGYCKHTVFFPSAGESL